MNAIKALKICYIDNYIYRKSDPRVRIYKNAVGAKHASTVVPGGDWTFKDISNFKMKGYNNGAKEIN